MTRIRAHAYVTGRVQGVWFRESTRRRAEELGVSGFVRNLADGRVEAVFEGDARAVRAALEFIHQGPPLAEVTDVQADEQAIPDESGAGASFEVR